MMMTIERVDHETVGVKVPGCFSLVKRDGTIKIADKVLEGPGEYDINRVGAHVYDGTATIFADGTRLDVVWDNKAKIANEEEVANDALLILFDDANAVTGLTKQIEAPIVLLNSEGLADKLAKEDGIEIAKEKSVKLTTGLSNEERSFILLV